MTDATENPYAAPPESEPVGPPPPRPRELPPAPYVLWIVVVLINLPIPVIFGTSASGSMARIGMPFGILVVAAIGCGLCGPYPRMMKNLSRGAILTALSQFYPMLHIFVGMIAIGICGATDHNLDGVFQVTAATVLTGVGLIIPSLVFGHLFAFIGGLLSGRP